MTESRRREVYKSEAIKLREEGCSYGEIVKILNIYISRSTLQGWSKDTYKAVRF